MYLVGDFSRLRDSWGGPTAVKVRDSITKNDLIRSKEDRDFLVIDLDKRAFFDPEKNAWVEIGKEK